MRDGCGLATGACGLRSGVWRCGLVGELAPTPHSSIFDLFKMHARSTPWRVPSRAYTVFGRVLCVHVDEAVMGPQYTRTQTERATTQPTSDDSSAPQSLRDYSCTKSLTLQL